MNEVEVAQFADDTALIAYSYKTSAIINKLQKASQKLLTYFHKWRICINGNKSEACLFTKKIAERHRPQASVRVNLDEVEWKNSLKYLGLHLDKRLTFKTHIEKTIEKSERLIRSLYPLINRRSRLSQVNKILLYKTVFRPMITYACPVWASCAKTHIHRLQILQNKILKMMLKLHWRTSTRLVHETSEIEMIKDNIDRITQNFWNRCQVNEDRDIAQIYEFHH